MSDTHAFRHIPRQDLTEQQRARLFLERKGVCHRCTRKIMAGEKWYDEHDHSLATGGGNEWCNRLLTCKNCFHPKNAEDARKLKKMRAIAVAHVIPPSQRQKKHPMPGSRHHRCGLRKRMNGTVEKW